MRGGERSRGAARIVNDEFPDVVGIGVEDEAHIGGSDEPVAAFEFSVELFWSPAGAAGEDAELEVFAVDGAADDLFENFSAVADVESGGDGGLLLVVLGGVVEDEEGVAFDGSAAVDLHVAVGEFKVSLEGLIDLDAGGTVDDESHSPLGVVLDHQDDALKEVGVAEVFAGDEEMPGEGLGHSRRVVLGGSE